MSIKIRSQFTCHVRGQKLRKKLRYRPWVVAPITMAATPAAFAGGGGRAAAASSTGTTIVEVSAGHRSPRSLWRLQPCAPTPTPNRHFGQNPNIRTPPISEFPSATDKSASSQVARSARRRSTSRLHERSRHVWRRGTVHTSPSGKGIALTLAFSRSMRDAGT